MGSGGEARGGILKMGADRVRCFGVVVGLIFLSAATAFVLVRALTLASRLLLTTEAVLVRGFGGAWDVSFEKNALEPLSDGLLVTRFIRVVLAGDCLMMVPFSAGIFRCN